MRGISASPSIWLEEAEDTGPGWTGADCGLSASKSDHDSAGNREPLEGLGALEGGAFHSDSWSQHAQWKRGERPEAGRGVKGHRHKGQGQQWGLTERLEEQIEEGIWRENTNSFLCALSSISASSLSL